MPLGDESDLSQVWCGYCDHHCPLQSDELLDTLSAAAANEGVVAVVPNTTATTTNCQG